MEYAWGILGLYSALLAYLLLGAVLNATDLKCFEPGITSCLILLFLLKSIWAILLLILHYIAFDIHGKINLLILTKSFLGL